MKKIKLIIIAMILMSTSLNYAQTQSFNNYINEYIDKSYDITITGKDTNKYDIWIDAYSLDDINKYGGIIIKNKAEESFKTALLTAKDKYIEWVNIAKQNNVKDLIKDMDIKIKGVETYFSYGNSTHFMFNVKLKFSINIHETKSGNIEYLLLVKTGELTASDNQFMKINGFVLIFTDINSIDAFLQIINHNLIIDYISKPKTDDLFKN